MCVGKIFEIFIKYKIKIGVAYHEISNMVADILAKCSFVMMIGGFLFFEKFLFFKFRDSITFEKIKKTPIFIYVLIMEKIYMYNCFQDPIMDNLYLKIYLMNYIWNFFTLYVGLVHGYSIIE